MGRKLLGSVITDNNGEAHLNYETDESTTFVSTVNNLEDEIIYNPVLYNPSFTSENPAPTTRLGNGYRVTQSNGEITLIDACLTDGWSNEGLWECDYDVKWSNLRYVWFRTLMALPNTVLTGGWEGCVASTQAGLGSNVQRDNNDCLTVLHTSIWNNPSVPYVHINIKKTSPTTLVVTKTGDTANNGTVTFTNCDLLDTYDRLSIGATCNNGTSIGLPTIRNLIVKPL